MGLPLWLFLWISACIKKTARPLRQAALPPQSKPDSFANSLKGGAVAAGD